MVPHRGPYGSSALLPYELALIQEVGLTVEEYENFSGLQRNTRLKDPRAMSTFLM